MDAASIFVFVLALVVAGNVALAWIIYDHRQRTRAEVSSLSTTVNALLTWRVKHTHQQSELGAKVAELEAQSPVELGVKVVELTDAVARLAKTHQRFAGRFDRQMADAVPDNAPPTLSREDLRREHASAMIPAGLKR